MILKWDDKYLQFERIEWSGTDTQASRQATFTLPSNPYDPSFEKVKIKLGDIVQLYENKKRVFIGVVTSREKTAEAGTASFTARDFMHYLLRSNATHKFKGMTAEAITKRVCKEVGVSTKSLPKTKVKIKKLYFQDQPIYDIIIKAFRKARVKTGRKYMPVMDGKSLTVITKGKSCGVCLEQSEDIISATYSDTTDNMVNLVKIYNDKLKMLGKVQNKTNIKKYGIYQANYTKEKDVKAKPVAKSMLVGITREASVEAIGNIKCIAGKSIQIHDKATGLSGWFYITADTHVFENGVHTMQLELSWKNTMEEGAETV